MTTHAPGGAHRPALARCVGTDLHTFATDHWGRAPLLRRAGDLADQGFTDLLSSDAVDELLSRRGLRTPFLRVAAQGAVLAPVRYTGSGGAGAEVADQVIDEKVLGLYADGATLVLQGLHRIWPPLIDFAGRLGAELAQPVQVNAYLTPPGRQGFATHYDTHDVFVLQVDGRKRWRIHPPVLADPLERHPWGGQADEVAAVAAGEPALDIVLAPGDALYLPRGWLHAASAQGERSLHLTVGVRALTRFALVEELTALATQHPPLRATVPFGLDLTDADEVEPELARTVEALRDWLLTVDSAAVARRLRERLWPAVRPAPIRPLAQLDAVYRLTPDSRVTVRAGLRWHVTADPPEHIVLDLDGRTLRFPAFCEAAVRAAVSGGVHRVGDLPGLDDDADRLVLVRRLLREAVTVPAD